MALSMTLLSPFFNRTRSKIEPGAHRLQKLLFKWQDDGILHFPSVLITGSNGKGTTCAFIESILRSSGFKTGLYTSPHLVHPSERIRINAIPIDEMNFETSVSEILEQSKQYLPDASFFEILTGAGLLIFLKEKIDFLVCEVGLGGYEDSTNAIAPLASAITSVSLEHTDILGDSLYQIAKDKAFVGRRNRPLIAAQSISGEALQGIQETAQKIGACLVRANFHESDFLEQSKRMQECHQINLCTAITLIKSLKQQLPQHQSFQITPDSIKTGIQNAFWPGRFDVRKIDCRHVILDASHNPDGFEFFLEQYKKSEFSNEKCVLLFASLNDKNWKKTLLQIPKIAHFVFFTQIDSDRTETVEHFEQHLAELKNHFVPYEIIKDTNTAIAKSIGYSPSSPLIITGSIAFLGSVIEHLKMKVFPDA